MHYGKHTDVFNGNYRCSSALYLISILSQAFYGIIDCGITEPGHYIEVIDGLNAIYKMFLFQLMSTMKLLGKKCHDTHMVMHNGIHTSDVILAR